MGAEEVISCRWCGLELTGDPYGVIWVSKSVHFTTSWCQESPDKVNRRHEPITAPSAERALRAHNRELANRMAVRGMWHEGTCVSCGLADLPVIGLPGSEYCRYCEELRVLKPTPPVMQSPPQPPSPTAHPGRLTVSMLLGLAGLLMAIADGPQLACALLLTASYLLAKAA